MTAPDIKTVFFFDRYINGIKMAEDVCVEREQSLSAAMVVASKIASRGPNGEVPVLVYQPDKQPPALAVPEVAAQTFALLKIKSLHEKTDNIHRGKEWRATAKAIDDALAALRGEGRP